MASVMVDTNLLVLLVVGLTSESMTEKHKRTKEYGRKGYKLLLETLSLFDRIVVTPHILAETSNLVRQCADPLKTQVGESLAVLVFESEEQAVPAERIARQPEYPWIGFTDAGVLEALSESAATLLTEDDGLYAASLGRGLDAINFEHLRAALTT